MNMRNKDAVILKAASLFCFRLCSIMKKEHGRAVPEHPKRAERAGGIM